MHAFLITGKSPKLLDKKIKDISKKFNAQIFPQEIKSINDARELSNLLRLYIKKPTAYLIRNIDKASIEALNSLLKAIEEPGENQVFIFTATSKNRVIPTIVSRCQVIETSKKDLGKDAKPLAQKFLDSDLSQKFQIISQTGDRDEAIILVENIMLIMQEKLLSHPSKKITKTIKNCEFTHKALQANGNINLQLTNLAIRIS